MENSCLEGDYKVHSLLTNTHFEELQNKALNHTVFSNYDIAKIFKLTNEGQILNLLTLARTVSDRVFGKHINFYYTSNYFPALSVTGTECALNCKHCGKTLLQRLTPVTTPKRFVETCKKLAKLGAKGVLITGGCSMNATVPINRFLDAITEVKKKTKLVLIAHTGLVDYSEAKDLVNAGLDGAAVDIVGSVETAKAVYGIEISPKSYGSSLKALSRAKLPIISPHVCVGLDFGVLKHELVALRIISEIKPTSVVITALMPLRRTPMETVKPAPMDVAKVIAIARLMFPMIPITLGCARSKGTDRELIERLAIYSGATSIAVPTANTIKEAQSLGMNVESYAACCAVPPSSSLKLHDPKVCITG